MKISELKHNHSLTDLLKVILFSIVMLLPFFNVLTRSLYVICNKNAYQSYSDTNGVEYTSAVGQTQVYGAEYEVRYNPNGNVATYEALNVLNNKTNAIKLYGGNEEKNLNYITIERSGQSLYFYYTDSTYQEVPNWYETSATFYYVASSTAVLNSNTSKYYSVYRITSTMGQLDNVFEYSLSKLETSELYNWTIQTAIYTGVSTMTTQLGITGNIIPIIVCYWFFMTIIYIIIDIILSLFKLLTHMFSKKTN